MKRLHESKNSPYANTELLNWDKVDWWVINGNDRDINEYRKGRNTTAKAKVDSFSKNHIRLLKPWEQERINASLYSLYDRLQGKRVQLVAGVKHMKWWSPLRAISSEKLLTTWFQNLWWKFDEGEWAVDCAFREVAQEEAQGIKIPNAWLEFDGVHYRDIGGKYIAIVRLVSTDNRNIESWIRTWNIRLWWDVEDARYYGNLFSQPWLLPMTAETYYDERKRGNKSIVTHMIEKAIARWSYTRLFASRAMSVLWSTDFTDFQDKDLDLWSVVEFSIYEIYARAVSQNINGDRSYDNQVLARVNNEAQMIASQHWIGTLKGITTAQFRRFAKSRNEELARVNKLSQK